MNLKITKEGFEFSSLIKMVSIGYAISTTLLFALVILVFALTKSSEFPIYKALLALIIIPIIAIFQGLFLGCAIAFGLFLYKKWRSIKVVTSE